MKELGGLVFVILVFAVCVYLYFIPTIVANKRGRKNKGAIFVLNLLLGWSFVGWVVALVWAAKEDDGAAASVQPDIENAPATKTCPHCAETVKAAAKVCKHCGSALDTPVAAFAPHVAQSAPDDHQATMAHYGIRFADGKYWFGSYAYDKLADAVNYASKAPKPA